MKSNDEDRRLKRSRRLLSSALTELLQEKRYIDITVQDIIDRADVGRTTFYTHYRDKEDLLVSSLEDVLVSFIHHMDQEDEGPGLLSTVEFFRHVKEHQNLYKAMFSGQGMALLFNQGQAMISQKIEEHLKSLPRRQADQSIPVPFVSNYLAGAFLVMLKWWIDHKLAYSPEQIDAMYQQLVMPGTLKALGIE